VKQKNAELLKITPPSTSSARDIMIFINTTMDDQALGKEIGEWLKEQGLISCLPIFEEYVSPADKRQDLEGNLLDCDGMIMPYEAKSLKWIREQLRYCRRLQGKREHPFKTIGVFNKTEQKTALGMNLPNLHILECSRLTNDTCLSHFIKTLS